MQTRIAVMGIIVEDLNSTTALNEILHQNANFIIGRMGLPYHKKNINIISVAIDAPLDVINTLSGKIGRLKGIQIKTSYAKDESEK